MRGGGGGAKESVGIRTVTMVTIIRVVTTTICIFGDIIYERVKGNVAHASLVVHRPNLRGALHTAGCSSPSVAANSSPLRASFSSSLMPLQPSVNALLELSELRSFLTPNNTTPDLRTRLSDKLLLHARCNNEPLPGTNMYLTTNAMVQEITHILGGAFPPVAVDAIFEVNHCHMPDLRGEPQCNNAHCGHNFVTQVLKNESLCTTALLQGNVLTCIPHKFL